MKSDIIGRLAAARPPHLEPGTPVDPATRDTELAAAFTAPPASARSRRSAVLAKPRRMGRAIGLGLTVAAAGTVAAVSVTMAVQAPAHAPTRRASAAAAVPARQILLTAAQSAAGAPVATGAHWFTDVQYASACLVRGRSRPYVVERLAEHRDWTSARSPGRTHAEIKAGRGGTTTHIFADRQLGARPVGAANVAAWKRAGSPTHWATTPGSGRCPPRLSTKGTAWDVEKEQTAFTHAFNDGSLRRLRKLPASPGGLRKFFLSHGNGDENSRQAGETTSEWLFDAAGYMLASEPVPPRVRAAAFRMLAGIPGVRDAGWVTDPLGRRGVAVVLGGQPVNGPPGTAEQIIVDPANGRLLAIERIVTRSGPPGVGRLPRGAVWLSQTMIRATWTNHHPRRARTPSG